jgi:hypothetical protein
MDRRHGQTFGGHFYFDAVLIKLWLLLLLLAHLKAIITPNNQHIIGHIKTHTQTPIIFCSQIIYRFFTIVPVKVATVTEEQIFRNFSWTPYDYSIITSLRIMLDCMLHLSLYIYFLQQVFQKAFFVTLSSITDVCVR